MAKREDGSQQPLLTFPKDDAEERIKQQIQKGNELLSSIGVISSESAYAELRNQYYSWTEFNSELLRRLFTTDHYAREYEGIAFGVVHRTLVKKIKELRDDVDSGIRTLESIVKRLELIPESPDVLASKSIASTSDKAAKHIVRQRHHFDHKPPGSKVFIGHGRSLVWREFKDFIEGRLGLPTNEFNSVSVAGFSTKERLSEMLDEASIAFLIMTGEDEQPGGTNRARENVVHEVGLFQGRLGFERAIVILEEGCEQSSNITGLGQIRFPKGSINSTFEEVRRVCEREEILLS